MRTDIEVKELLDKYNVMPKSRQRTKISRLIRDEKKNLVEKKNYVGIIHITQSMGDYDKDRLFLDLLKSHPESSLFVLAFANADMHSYILASEMENLDYDHDVEALQKDIELTFDEMLCKYLSVHGTKADFNFVQELADGASWLKSYKMAHGLSQFGWSFLTLKFTGTDSFSFSSFFEQKKTPK